MNDLLLLTAELVLMGRTGVYTAIPDGPARSRVQDDARWRLDFLTNEGRAGELFHIPPEERVMILIFAATMPEEVYLGH